MKYDIRNKGNIIGSIKANIKRIGLMSMVGFTILSTSGCHKAEEEQQEVIDMSEYEKIEPTYDILYITQPGDTISELVYDYEDDNNRAEQIIHEIERDINDYREYGLAAGTEITLYKVPESKLENYNMTVDYSVLDPIIEVEDIRHYLQIHLDDYNKAASKSDRTLFKSKLEELDEMYEDYNNNDDMETKEYLVDYMLDEYRDLCSEFDKVTGFSFEYGKLAHPIPNENDIVLKN